MLQPLGEGVHPGAGGGHWCGALRPADGGGDVDRGDERLVRCGQLRLGSDTVLDLQGGRFTARRAQRQDGDGQQGVALHGDVSRWFFERDPLLDKR
ncbi:hypothetical protein D3C76_1080290 [compost metagenome]